MSESVERQMLHDTRVIPLDGRAQASTGVRQYMGSSVGRFEGNTLVVETTNFTDVLHVNPRQRVEFVENVVPRV